MRVIADAGMGYPTGAMRLRWIPVYVVLVVATLVFPLLAVAWAGVVIWRRHRRGLSMLPTRPFLTAGGVILVYVAVALVALTTLTLWTEFNLGMNWDADIEGPVVVVFTVVTVITVVVLDLAFQATRSVVRSIRRRTTGV